MNPAAFASSFAAIDGGDPGLRRIVAIHAADALACLAAGARTSEGAAIAAFYAGAEGGGTPSTLSCAAGAAAVIRFTEWDDIHVPSCLTPASVAVPAALALAADVERFVAAVEAACATGMALAQAVGGAAALPYGVWPTLLAAPATAAAAAAVALGLPREATAHALAMALAAGSGRNGRPAGSPSARWLAIGEATLKGMRAALAARAGFRGDLGLPSPAWFRAQSEAAVAPPDDRLPLPGTAIARVGLKPFVAARQGMNAIEGFRRILAEGIAAPAIERIRVSLPPVALPVASRPLDTADRLSTIAHLGLQLGLAAFTPDRLCDVGREERLPPDALALAGRVELTGDAALAGGTPGSWPARIAVRVGGDWVERTCARIPGDPGDAQAAAELVLGKLARLPERPVAMRLRRILCDLPEGRAEIMGEARAMLAEAIIGGGRAAPAQAEGSKVEGPEGAEPRHRPSQGR